MHFAVVTERLVYGDDVTYRASIPELDIDAYGKEADDAFEHLQEVCEIELAHRKALGIAVPTPQLLSSLVTIGIATDLSDHIVSNLPAPEIVSSVNKPIVMGERIVFA